MYFSVEEPNMDKQIKLTWFCPNDDYNLLVILVIKK